MQFGVIFEVNVPRDEDVELHLMSNMALFERTEGDEERPYEYLGEAWEGHKHRKFVACLTGEQFQTFVEEAGLYAEDVETMGSLGAPTPDGAMELSVSPAISFRHDVELHSAYVTPYPDTRKDPPFSERDWERVRRAVIRQFGY